MAGDRNHPALEGAGEVASVLGGRLRRGDAVAAAMGRDGRHRNRWLLRQALLDRLQRRVALRIAEAMAVGLDHDIDKIRVVEGTRALLIGRVVELPVRRPQAPEQAAERVPIRCYVGSATI